MRVLYVASRTPQARNLLVEHEVTKLQRQLRAKAGVDIDFKFLPAIAFQDLRNEVELYRPDVLHISAHGNAREVHFVDLLGRQVDLNPNNISAALGVRFRPHVLYLSACSSAPVAEQMRSHVPVTIGTTEDIENYFARETSMAFYENLYAGCTIQEAFEVSRSLLETLDKTLSTKMFCQSEDAARRVLYRPPQLVARFSDLDDQKADKFYIEPGFLGVPDNTNQIVFFTNDLSFRQSDDSLEEDLCWINREPDHETIRWLGEYWNCSEDFRMFATAVTNKGEFKTVYAKVTDALTAHYDMEAARGSRVPRKIKELIAAMRPD